MYLEPWQIFLGGCVVGTLISRIVLFILIVNTLKKLGVNGIHIHDISELPKFDTGNDAEGEDDPEPDLLAKLSFILLNRGCITDDDMDFMTETITFDEWKKRVESELEESERNNVDDAD